MEYKLIIAPDPYTLEARVNKFIEDNKGHHLELVGTIQVLGHEQYCQQVEIY